MKKRIISFVLVLLIAISIVPVTVVTASAASSTYNVSDALKYAKKNWNNGKGLCAEFASRCLMAGGIDVFNTMADGLYYDLKDTYGTSYQLTLTGGKKGTVKMADNEGKIKKGDPVFYRCNKCKRITHVVICNGENSKGYCQDYAHNNPHDGTKQTYTYKHCGTDNWTLYSIRMYEPEKLYGKKSDVDVPEISSLTNSEKGVYVKWDKVSDADKYRVYRKTEDSSWKKITDTKSAYCTDETAKHGKTYTYMVRAIEDGILSQYYAGEEITRISAPVLTRASNISSGIKIKWGKIDNADGYYIYRKSGTSVYKRIAQIQGNSIFSYTDKNVVDGEKYTYTVKACDGKVLSGYDKDGVSCIRLSPIKNIKAKSTSKGITITFSACEGADRYAIYRKNEAGSWVRLGFTEGTKKSFTDKNVIKGETYTYTVRAFNEKLLGSLNSKGVACKYK